MRAHLLFSILILGLTSCGDPSTQENNNNEIPKALDDKPEYRLSKRDYNSDLLESLYGELLTKSPELKDLQDEIDDIWNSEDDFTKVFKNYDEKNRTYYSVAGIHVKSIKDSVLREKVRSLLASSLSGYQDAVKNHNNLLATIGKQKTILKDLHAALKITRTLPIMIKFQKENLPTTGSLEGFLNQLNKTIEKGDTLVKY